jgi:rhodanese-related sulfurtransferase
MIAFFKKFFKPSADIAKLVKEGAVIVDVRTKGKYQAGHIEGSKNIPLDAIKKEVESLKKLKKPVVTVCRSGNCSGMGEINIKVCRNGGLQWRRMDKFKKTNN